MAKKEKGTQKPKRQKGAFKHGAAMLWSFLKGYRILTFLTPFTILLDVLIELKLPEIMGDVTDYIMYHAGTDTFVRHDLNMLLLKMLALNEQALYDSARAAGNQLAATHLAASIPSTKVASIAAVAVFIDTRTGDISIYLSS